MQENKATKESPRKKSGRPNLRQAKHDEFLPLIASAFSELGYRKTTTVVLAKRCNTQENVLYRVWPSKKAMFVASIDYLFDATMNQWQSLLEIGDNANTTPAQRILNFDAEHRGEAGFYKITFAALSETDDNAVKEALSSMYKRFAEYVQERLEEHQTLRPQSQSVIDAKTGTWIILGVATMMDIARTTGNLNAEERVALMKRIGALILPS